MAVGIVSTMKAGLLFRPVAGVLPAGRLSTDEYNAEAQAFTNLATALWNSGQFTTQGQQWEAVSETATDGCRNAATPRISGGTRYNHVTEFEFLFTGSALDIAFIGGAYYDSQVYVEHGGRMYKAQTAPLAGTTPGLMHRRLVFAAAFHGRIRVHLGGGLLVGVLSEQSAIVKPAPPRPFAICDGSDWADGAGVIQTSGTSYLTAGLCDYLFERTGIAWARRAQAGTGFFCNGASTVADDVQAAADASTRWFSAVRKGWMTGAGPSGVSDFAGKPLFYLLVGTRVDGGRSDATGSASGPMATRELECLQWVRSQDPLCTIVHVSPSPFTGAGAAGSVTGPPTAGSPHDLNRQEQEAAITRVPRARYVNAFGPAAPWFTGAGSNGSPTSSQQAALIGVDGVNPDAHGFDFYAAKIAAELALSPVHLARARGQR